MGGDSLLVDIASVLTQPIFIQVATHNKQFKCTHNVMV